MTPSFLRTMSIAGALLAIGYSTAAHAAYPDRPVRLVVPYAAGGPTDTFARALAETWGKELGVTMIIDNRSGAGTVVGTEAVAKSAPDGYTVLLTTVALAVNPAIHQTLPYRTKEDFSPVGLAARAPLVLVVNKDVPAQTLPEFIEYLEKRPGQVNFGSAGIGSAPHLGGALLNYMGKLQAVHVPYRGSAPAMADLLGGHVEFMVDSAPTALAQVNAGTVRIWARPWKSACRKRRTPRPLQKPSPGTRHIPGTRPSCPTARPTKPFRS